MDSPSWDCWFMSQAYMIALKSKDQSTKVGSIVVGEDHEPLTSGYNSFPRGAVDNLPERQERPLKYEYFEHAERNAIYNAARHGARLLGSTMYVTMFPCMDCARGIINSGISEVVYHAENPRNQNLSQNQVRSQKLMIECGVTVRAWSGDLLEIQALADEKIWNKG